MAVVADELLLMVRANVSQAMAGLSAVETKATRMGTMLAGAGAIAGKAILATGAIAVATGVAATKMALDFEESMAKIKALVGVPEEEMALLEDAALRMGGQFGISAEEAAGGLFFLKSAGLETGDAIKALEEAAMASAMGLGSMEELSNTATTAMSNFGITSGDAFDMITTAARLAKADPAELGRIMNQNSATADLLGLSYEELGGLSALLTRKFGDASMSGTALGAVMNKIVKPSQQAEDMLKKIGMTAGDMQELVSEKGLAGALGILNDSFADSGIATGDWIAKVMEDSRGIKGAAAILGTGADELNEILLGMDESSGALTEGWEVMAETGNVRLRKAFEGLKSALIPVGTTIIEFAIPAIEALIGWIQRGVEWFSEFAGTAENVKTRFQPFLDILDSLIGYFTTIFETGDSLNDYLADMPDWFQPIIQAIGDFVVFVQESWRAVYDAIVGKWQEIWDYVYPLIVDMGNFIIEQFTKIRDWFDTNGENIKQIFVKFLGWIQRFWERIWGAISQYVMGIWDGMKRMIFGVIGTILGIIQTVMALITGDWETAWEGLKNFLSGILEAILGYVSAAWHIMQLLFKTGIALIQGAWDGFWEIAGNVVKALWDGAVGMVTTGVNGVLAGLEWLANKAIDVMNKMVTAWNNANLFLNFADLDYMQHVSLGAFGDKISGGGTREGSGARASAIARNDALHAGDGTNVTFEAGSVNVTSADAQKLAAELGWELTKIGG